MIPISFDDVEFKEDKIVWRDGGGTIISFREVYAMAYKKPSLSHWLSMKYDWMAMGLLYIGKRTTVRVPDLIPICISYSDLKKLPKCWQEKIEFYHFGEITTLHRVIG